MVSYCGSVSACPRRSNVRQTQPSAAISRALTRYCCWFPRQPCTNRTAGTTVAGATSVPRMYWPSTAMSILSSRVAIALHHRVFGNAPGLLVFAAKVDSGVCRHGFRFAVKFDAGRAYDGKLRVLLESLQGRDLGPAGAADSPRLFEHGAALRSRRIDARNDVVVSTRGKELGKKLCCGRVERMRPHDGAPGLRRRFDFEQRVETAAEHNEFGPAVSGRPALVGRQPLRAVIGRH